jgi:alpha-1,6-mannosyltransferase
LFARDVALIGAAARRRAEIRHSWDATFENLSLLYGELCGMPARSSSVVVPLRPQFNLAPSF